MREALLTAAIVTEPVERVVTRREHHGHVHGVLYFKPATTMTTRSIDPTFLKQHNARWRIVVKKWDTERERAEIRVFPPTDLHRTEVVIAYVRGTLSSAVYLGARDKLDKYVREGRSVHLEITGTDLVTLKLMEHFE